MMELLDMFNFFYYLMLLGWMSYLCIRAYKGFKNRRVFNRKYKPLFVKIKADYDELMATPNVYTVAWFNTYVARFFELRWGDMYISLYDYGKELKKCELFVKWYSEKCRNTQGLEHIAGKWQREYRNQRLEQLVD